MSRSTFSVLFYVNRGKEKNNVVPVMGRVTINCTQSQFSCKKSIPLALWDAKGNCAKGRSKEALQLNRDLDNIKAQIIKHYQHLCDREAFVTAEMVRNSYHGFGSEYETLLMVAHCHNGSCTHVAGNPICSGLTDGYFISNDFKSETKVFFWSMAFSQYAMQQRIGYNLNGCIRLLAIQG